MRLKQATLLLHESHGCKSSSDARFTDPGLEWWWRQRHLLQHLYAQPRQRLCQLRSHRSARDHVLNKNELPRSAAFVAALFCCTSDGGMNKVGTVSDVIRTLPIAA